MPDRNAGKKAAVYFHVPFCRQPRCAYCDFYSTAADTDAIARWKQAVITECRQAHVDRFGDGWSAGTVFFGGGTPSLLTPGQLGGLLGAVHDCWGLAPDAEITVECNPEDVHLEWADGCLEAGINRLSIGVQSFDPDYLTAIGRCHRPGQAEQALKAAREAGFGRISADLILGGPGSGEKIILDSISRALELGIEHLSVYGYHLDPPAAGYGLARYSPLDDDAWSEQYLAACRLLADKGWRHYEISNWAHADSAICTHNMYYWLRRPYLGLGPSAHSFGPGQVRSSNRPDLDGYLEGAVGGDFSAVRESETLDEDMVLFESVMLGLRLDTGVELELLGRIHGADADRKLARLIGKKLACRDGDRLHLTDSGFLLYDTLAVELAPPPLRAG